MKKILAFIIVTFFVHLTAQAQILHEWSGYNFLDLEKAFKAEPMFGNFIESIRQPAGGNVYEYPAGSDIFVQRSGQLVGLEVYKKGDLADIETSDPVFHPDSTIQIRSKIKVEITYKLDGIDPAIKAKVAKMNFADYKDESQTYLEMDPNQVSQGAAVSEFDPETQSRVTITAWCNLREIFLLSEEGEVSDQGHIKLTAKACVGADLGQLRNQLKLVKIFKEAGLFTEEAKKPKVYHVHRTEKEKVLVLQSVDCSDKSLRTYAKGGQCFILR